jgi:uncharacterized protein YdbL (DUF1318 family)
MTEPRRCGLAASCAWLACAGVLTAAGCVRAPEVAVVSEHTALERQAAGEYPEETELEAASISPGPIPIPREQLSSGGEASGLGVVDEMVARAETDETHLDALLLARCIGEARTGLLEVTTDACQQEVDPNEVARLVGRANVHRRQVWTYIAAQSPGTTEDQARVRWRALHLQRVVCGAQVQSDAGHWEPKPCGK